MLSKHFESFLHISAGFCQEELSFFPGRRRQYPKQRNESVQSVHGPPALLGTRRCVSSLALTHTWAKRRGEEGELRPVFPSQDQAYPPPPPSLYKEQLLGKSYAAVPMPPTPTSAVGGDGGTLSPQKEKPKSPASVRK